MAYAIHIETEDGIELEEWLEAVEQVASVRPIEEDITTENPETEEVIAIETHSGDVECFDPETGKTKLFILFGEESAQFRAPVDFGEVRTLESDAVFDLADLLGATVVGDSDEVYERPSQEKPKVSADSSIDFELDVSEPKKWWEFWK